MMELHKETKKRCRQNYKPTQRKEVPLTLELQNNKIIKKGINGVPRGKE
jgi:hypothetical protein